MLIISQTMCDLIERLNSIFSAPLFNQILDASNIPSFELKISSCKTMRNSGFRIQRSRFFASSSLCQKSGSEKSLIAFSPWMIKFARFSTNKGIKITFALPTKINRNQYRPNAYQTRNYK
jgi:hypothetical protein